MSLHLIFMSNSFHFHQELEGSFAQSVSFSYSMFSIFFETVQQELVIDMGNI